MQKDLLNSSEDGLEENTDFQTRNFQKSSEFDGNQSDFDQNLANLQYNVTSLILIGFQ